MSTKLHFDSPFSFRKSLAIIRHVVQELGYPFDVREDLEGNLSQSLPISDFSDPSMLWRHQQCLALFKKNNAFPPVVDTTEAALSKFLESEDKCRQTNVRLRDKVSLRTLERFKGASLIFEVSRKIDHILGPVPDLSELDFGFGPGANVGLSRFTSIRRKLSSPFPSLTTNAWRFLEFFQAEFPFWTNLMASRPVQGGKLTFVPKSSMIDRPIVVEPLINSFAQKGIGSYIRSKLRRFGCDLTDQAANQRLARQGSITGEYATIDLESASDTISYELVKALLPPAWFDLLCECRSPSYRLPCGDFITPEKFSSMGNGYTFELESLIFFALSSVICGKSIFSVYGDDIIIPTDKFETMHDCLSQFGFSLNLEKSFWSGQFRESCGADYLGGVSVGPCYLKNNFAIK